MNKDGVDVRIYIVIFGEYFLECFSIPHDTERAILFLYSLGAGGIKFKGKLSRFIFTRREADC